MSALVVAVSCGEESKRAQPGSQDAGADAEPEPCPTAPDVQQTPPPDPGPAAPPPSAECGTPTFASGTGLRRAPYLQSVTQTSLLIAWTMIGGSEGKVRVAPDASGPWVEHTAASELFPTTRTGDTEDYVAFAAAVTGMTPNRRYCYEVWADGAPLATGLRFDTAWSGSDRPVRVLAFGDSGNASPEQLAVRDAFSQREFDVFLHLGDMAYGDGTFTEFEERVFDVYRDFMHRVPSFPTIGNHEYKTDWAQPYLDVYYLFEQALRAEDQERYYSFDYGNVHFVSLDSNSEMLVPIQLDQTGVRTDDMIDWLEADLAASKADWKIAFFHHPPFSKYEDRDENLGVLDLIMPALANGGVDLILVGHDHHYVRSLPVRGECRVPGGKGAIPFIVVGSGGTGLHTFDNPKDWWVAAKNDQIHAFLDLTVHGCSAKGRAIDVHGQVIDEFELNGCEP